MFGPAKFVRASANPLFAVGELEGVDFGSYNNLAEVQSLAAPHTEFPVIEFELHPKTVVVHYRSMVDRKVWCVRTQAVQSTLLNCKYKNAVYLNTHVECST